VLPPYSTQIILTTKSQPSKTPICAGLCGTSALRCGTSVTLCEGSGVYQTRPFCGSRGRYLYLLPSPPMVIFFLIHSFTNRSALSLQAWCSQLPCSNLRDYMRDLALESVRKLKKILLLHSCALGEALAAWCVRYSWSLAPRRLAVTRVLLILYG
jgi:hypothetical protein